ncbi:MAG: hypothetical protein QM523_06570 [Candidatus Pacebacteria bacterium]|nr:hypothetical protein [Candidatus Paceibacterota bacterium]
MTDLLVRDSGSFRDSSAYLFRFGNRIIRGLSARALDNYLGALKSGLIERAVEQGLLIASTQLNEDQLLNIVEQSSSDHPQPSVGRTGMIGARGENFAAFLEHPLVPMITYPYEWCFEQLKDAALQHLKLQLLALEFDYELSDATAYNMQFNGNMALPLHIDPPSLRPYRPGRPWEAYNQFCRQFLYPLLLENRKSVPFQRYYRGSLNGIDVNDMAQFLSPWQKWSSLTMLIHVQLQASAIKRSTSNDIGENNAAANNRLKIPVISKSKYQTILTNLQDVIQGLKSQRSKTYWADYAQINSYSDQQKQAKRKFIKEKIEIWGCNTIADIGGNTGEYSEAALKGGAKIALCLDSDIDAVSVAYAKHRSSDHGLLPLVMDWSDPSPSQGWGGYERKSLRDRMKVDAVLALAIIHHIVIGGNVPMMEFIKEIFSYSNRAIIEFVPKSDPMVMGLLRHREDIFSDYNEENFVDLLKQIARIEGVYRFSDTKNIGGHEGRVLHANNFNQGRVIYAAEKI